MWKWVKVEVLMWFGRRGGMRRGVRIIWNWGIRVGLSWLRVGR